MMRETYFVLVFFELSWLLSRCNLGGFSQKICTQKAKLCLFLSEIGSANQMLNYLWIHTIVNDNLYDFQKIVVRCQNEVFCQLYSRKALEGLQYHIQKFATQDLYVKHIVANDSSIWHRMDTYIGKFAIPAVMRASMHSKDRK